MTRTLFFSLACTTLFLTSCQQDTQSPSLQEQSQLSKPSVAIVPLIDNSEHQLDWNLSDELTYTLCSKLDQKNKLSIASPQKMRLLTKRLKQQHNPFGESLSWIKETFAGHEFVVFLELIEHREVLKDLTPQALPETLSAELKIATRIRIVDLRDQEPKITLQEILQDSHFVPRQFTRYNFHQAPWNSDDFSLSPVGIAHAQLIKEIGSRIEDYIFLAKSQKL